MGQMAVLSIYILVFTIVAFVFRYDKITPQSELKKIVLLVSGMVSIIVIIGYIYLKKSSIYNLPNLLKTHYLFIIILIIALGLRLPMLNQMPRWDGGEYYESLYRVVDNFQYSVSQFFVEYQLCGHPTLAYALIYSVGEIMFHGKVIGVNLVNLILTGITLGSLYGIIRKILPDISNNMAAVYTFIISVLPLFLGTFGYVNLDYALALFTVCAIGAYLYKYYLLLFICTICMVQTKETGTVLVAGMFCGICLENLLKYKKSNPIKKVLTDASVYVIGIVIVLQLLFMKWIGGVSNWATPNEHSQSMFRWNNNGDNCFGWNTDYIVTKLKQFFGINFNWIFTLMIIVFICFFIYQILKRDKIRVPYEVTVILTILASFWAFSLIYITAILHRYNVISCILWALLAELLFHLFISKVKEKGFSTTVHSCLTMIKALILVVVSGLLVVESYLTIDPVTKQMFTVQSTGSSDIVYTGSSKVLKPSLNDYMVYNNQYTYLDKALDFMLKDLDYDENTDIYLFTEQEQLRIEGNPYVYDIYWDKVAKKRVLVENENTIKFSIIRQLDMFNEKKVFKENAVCFFTPIYRISEQRGLEIVSKAYEVEQGMEYNTVQGCFSYYRLKRKPVLYS